MSVRTGAFLWIEKLGKLTAGVQRWAPNRLSDHDPTMKVPVSQLPVADDFTTPRDWFGCEHRKEGDHSNTGDGQNSGKAKD